jgi:hypothetical protein
MGEAEDRSKPSPGVSITKKFFDNGRFYYLSQEIIPGLCITKMHTASPNLSISKQKLAKYISIMRNCVTPKKMVEDQSADYVVIHVGKKYPSPWPPIMYKSP